MTPATLTKCDACRLRDGVALCDACAANQRTIDALGAERDMAVRVLRLVVDADAGYRTALRAACLRLERIDLSPNAATGGEKEK